MATYQFLSSDWIAAARQLRQEHASSINSTTTAPLKVNLVIESAPFEESRLQAHVDTTSAEPQIDLGHISEVDATVTTDYNTAKEIFVEANLAAALEGYQLGRIKVDGDMMKLMGLASINADAGSIALAQAIKAMTA